MSNIISFPSAQSSTWSLLKNDLHASDEPKGLLNVYSEVSTIGRLLPGLACDPLTIAASEQGLKVDLASTFIGAAALCSHVVVHDIAALNKLGCVVDGHVLWVPQQFLREQLRKSEEDMVAWMRDGVAVCANTALGRPGTSTQWTVVQPEDMRVVLQQVSSDIFEYWAPNSVQDRARYQSALQYCGVE